MGDLCSVLGIVSGRASWESVVDEGSNDLSSIVSKEVIVNRRSRCVKSCHSVDLRIAGGKV